MTGILLAGGNTAETAEQVASFDFAEPWRRVLSVLVNQTAAASLFVVPMAVGARDWVVWSVFLSGILAHLVFHAVVRNSPGGWLSGAAPVGYRGQQLPVLVLLGREWLWATGFSVVGFLSELMFMPLTLGLREVFGGVLFLTQESEPGSGWRTKGTIGGVILPTVLGILMLRDMARGPYHQAWHDRFTRSVVVRSRRTVRPLSVPESRAQSPA